MFRKEEDSQIVAKCEIGFVAWQQILEYSEILIILHHQWFKFGGKKNPKRIDHLSASSQLLQLIGVSGFNPWVYFLWII